MGREIVSYVGIALSIAVVAAFVLVGGWMIGSSVAYSTQAERNWQMSCVDKGGHIEYVTNIGNVCRK